ncbi:MAG: hypothetical protein QOG46_1782, partial [Pseudonocardiales bacterium]|nr:hypothetical protein [Pseudonocardiales bacterium]
WTALLSSSGLGRLGTGATVADQIAGGLSGCLELAGNDRVPGKEVGVPRQFTGNAQGRERLAAQTGTQEVVCRDHNRPRGSAARRR